MLPNLPEASCPGSILKLFFILRLYVALSHHKVYPLANTLVFWTLMVWYQYTCEADSSMDHLFMLNIFFHVHVDALDFWEIPNSVSTDIHKHNIFSAEFLTISISNIISNLLMFLLCNLLYSGHTDWFLPLQYLTLRMHSSVSFIIL